MAKMKGGCMCGKVTYDSAAQPALTAVCHCLDCQKQSGSAMSIIVAVPGNEITFKGDLKLYKTVGKDTGLAVNRYFCPNCGSPLYSHAEFMDEMIFIKAGTLDDTSWLKPDMNIWCDTAQSWVDIDAAIPKFGGNPAAA
ncbi:MAG: hypothetical protein ACI8XZ_003311 [Gammaproteobacteria bacterium]|jgi:hypothetical protein